MWAGFLSHAGIEMYVRLARQRGSGYTGHGDNLCALPFDRRNDTQQFFGLAGIGERKQYVVARNHAKVAMAGFGRMHKIGRGAGAGHGGRYFAGNMARFAHATHDQAARTVQDQLDGAHKVFIDSAFQGVDRGSLYAQGLATQFQSAFRREAGGRLTWVHGQAEVMMAQVYLTSSNGLERTLTRPPSARRLGSGRGCLSALQFAAGPRLPVCW